MLRHNIRTIKQTIIITFSNVFIVDKPYIIIIINLAIFHGIMNVKNHLYCYLLFTIRL